MRKSLIILLMLFLPLQWGTTALAAYCLHENDTGSGPHFGHHGHSHEHLCRAMSGDGGQADMGWDGDCGAEHDHSHGTHAISSTSRQPGTVPSATVVSPYGTFVPDPPPDNLLRPPRNLRA